MDSSFSTFSTWQCNISLNCCFFYHRHSKKIPFAQTSVVRGHLTVKRVIVRGGGGELVQDL